VHPVRDDRNRHLRRDVPQLLAGQVTAVPVRVADALFLQTVRDCVDDAFYDETGVFFFMVLPSVNNSFKRHSRTR